MTIRGNQAGSGPLRDLARKMRDRQVESQRLREASLETPPQADDQEAETASAEVQSGVRAETPEGDRSARLTELDRAFRRRHAQLLDKSASARGGEDPDGWEAVARTAPAPAGQPEPGRTSETVARPAAPTPAKRRRRPMLFPAAWRRPALAVVIVVAAGAAGLLAGQGSGEDEGTVAAAPDSTVLATADYGRALGHELERLSAERDSELKQLRAARTPGDQAGASTELARAHRRAAASLARSASPSPIRETRATLIDALRRSAKAYGALASAAASSDKLAYQRASRSALGAEGALDRLIDANLRAVGGRT